MLQCSIGFSLNCCRAGFRCDGGHVRRVTPFDAGPITRHTDQPAPMTATVRVPTACTAFAARGCQRRCIRPTLPPGGAVMSQAQWDLEAVVFVEGLGRSGLARSRLRFMRSRHRAQHEGAASPFRSSRQGR